MKLSEITLSATRRVNEWIDGIRQINNFDIYPRTINYGLNRNELYTHFGELLESPNVMDILIQNEKREILEVLLDLNAIQAPWVYMCFDNNDELSFTADVSIYEHLNKLIYRFPNEAVCQKSDKWLMILRENFSDF